MASPHEQSGSQEPTQNDFEYTFDAVEDVLGDAFVTAAELGSEDVHFSLNEEQLSRYGLGADYDAVTLFYGFVDDTDNPGLEKRMVRAVFEAYAFDGEPAADDQETDEEVGPAQNLTIEILQKIDGSVETLAHRSAGITREEEAAAGKALTPAEQVLLAADVIVADYSESAVDGVEDVKITSKLLGQIITAANILKQEYPELTYTEE